MAENTAGQTLTQNRAGDARQNVATGSVVFDATAIVVTDFVRIRCGFKPKFVKWENATNNIGGEFFESMAANTALRTVAAGTRNTATTGFTLRDDGFEVLQTAAATGGWVVASSTARWMAVG